jgi:hypothetical protein
MSNYTRTTRTCPVSQLNPGLSQPIREFFQTHQLGDAETGTLKCCETLSEKSASSKLAALLEGNPDTTSRLAILLTPDWLIWARSGDRTGTVVSGCKLIGLQVKAFTARRTQYMQLEVSAFIGDSKEYVRGNLELGPELAAQNFCEEVGQAVLKVNPPVKRKFPRWMGG